MSDNPKPPVSYAYAFRQAFLAVAFCCVVIAAYWLDAPGVPSDGLPFVPRNLGMGQTYLLFCIIFLQLRAGIKL